MSISINKFPLVLKFVASINFDIWTKFSPFFFFAAYPSIKALVSGSVGLPCNISQSKEENSIKLILWYKNNVLGTPIYSIDARDSNMSNARHFVATPYRDRATFELNINTHTALLMLRPLRSHDDGQYICRVDFRWTRTTISTVKLDVIGEFCVCFFLFSFSFFVHNLAKIKEWGDFYSPKRTAANLSRKKAV